MSEPSCKEVTVGHSVGGQVQLVKYSLQNDFSYSESETWTIPEGWDDEQVEEFKVQRALGIKERIEALAQKEQDALLEAADWYRSS